MELVLPRKNRIDTATSAVLAASAQSVTPPSNVPLSEKDIPFFASVIDEFARFEWSPHQLELAAMLARKMSDMEEQQTMLRSEGYVVSTEKGTPISNPRIQTVRMLDTSIMATRRSLSLHARAKDGETRDVGKRRGKAKESEARDVDDDLLARPN